MVHVRSIDQVKKYWATLLFGTFTTLAIYLALHSHSRTLTLTPPILATPSPPLPTQHEEMTLDDTLKLWYPVEHALLGLFPQEITKVMSTMNNNRQYPTKQQQQHSNTLNTLIMNWILHWRPPPFSWSQYYRSIVKHQDPPTSYQCQDLSLPYPILRHMVKQALQLNESTKPNYPMIYHPSAPSPDLSQPFILLPFDPQDRTVAAGEPICIRVIIPPSVLARRQQQQPMSPFHYRYQPYSSSMEENDTTTSTLVWWDMMQVSARHLSTNASTTFAMQPWHGHKTLRDGYEKKWFEHENSIPNWSRRMMADMDERHWLHVYETNAVLMDPGHYVFDGKLEFQDAYWNTDLGPVQPYQPLSLPVEPSTGVMTTSNNDDVKQLVLDHLALPLCRGGQGDHAGRWLPWPFGDLVDASRMVAGLDKHGKFWAPTSCRYRPLTHPQFHRCLAQRYPRGMNIYGDSNMRRSIKSFLSHGQWCKDYHLYSSNNNNATITTTTTFTTPQQWEYTGDPNQLRACQCEDFKEPTWNPAWFNATARRWDVVFDNSDDETRQWGHPTEWDTIINNNKDGIRVSSYKWDGLTFMNDQGWQASFTQPRYTLPTATDIVVISLVNWDMAYMQLDEFQQALGLLVQHLKAQYDDHHMPLVIYRTPQYYCCRVDQTSRQRKSNTARMRIFDQMARQHLQAAFQQHWMIWDVTKMGEARTWDEKLETSTCGANHAQADVIHLENQVLMNALCNPF
ncbi:unnamed protein product [Absidia cylindrospora]